jgi:hypothetical protein
MPMGYPEGTGWQGLLHQSQTRNMEQFAQINQRFVQQAKAKVASNIA